MRVVALCGSGNVGKTKSLKELIKVCYARGAIKVASQPCVTSQNDVVEVFVYNGRRVCVSTCGDVVAAIDDGFNIATTHSCDVFVTASRGQVNCLTLARVCSLAGSGNYPILLSAYGEPPQAWVPALNARVDALLRCI